jgi:hypothetical protein
VGLLLWMHRVFVDSRQKESGFKMYAYMPIFPLQMRCNVRMETQLQGHWAPKLGTWSDNEFLQLLISCPCKFGSFGRLSSPALCHMAVKVSISTNKICEQAIVRISCMKLKQIPATLISQRAHKNDSKQATNGDQPKSNPRFVPLVI